MMKNKKEKKARKNIRSHITYPLILWLFAHPLNFISACGMGTIGLLFPFWGFENSETRLLCGGAEASPGGGNFWGRVRLGKKSWCTNLGETKKKHAKYPRRSRKHAWRARITISKSVYRSLVSGCGASMWGGGWVLRARAQKGNHMSWARGSVWFSKI